MQRLALVLALVCLGSGTVRADERYRQAPAAIHDVLRARSNPLISVSPDGR